MNSFRLAILNTFRNRRRAGLTIVLIAVATAGLVDNQGLISFIFDGLRDEAIYGRYGHVQLYRAGYALGHRHAPYSFLISDQDFREAQEKLQKTPGVEQVHADLSMPAVLSSGSHKATAIALGVEPSALQTLSKAKLVAGKEDLSDAGAQPSVLLGRGLAEKLEARPGDMINVMVATEDGSYNAADLMVQGIFEEGFRDFDDWSIKLSLPALQRLSGQAGVETIKILLHKTADTAALQRSLESDPAFTQRLHLETTSWKDMAVFYGQVVAMFGKELAAIRIIIEIIAFLAVVICITLSFAEREREMAVLLAMGMTRMHLMLLFTQETLCLGVAGAVLGSLFSIVGAVAISAIGISMPPPPGSTVPFIARDELSLQVLLQYALLALGVSLLASLVPALWISKLNVANALRPEEG